jgi:tetratricopeptide (TPR) repeat protein
MRRTLVALWFADIAGYSARAAEDESCALQLIEILQALSRQIVRRYNGRVVKFGSHNEPHLEKAREASARALKPDPESAEAHVAAGQGFSMEQRNADAAKEFERVIEYDPTLFDAYYYYGRSCFKNGDLKKSLGLFQQAQEVRPEDYEAIYLSSLVLRQLGRNEESRAADE